MSNFTPETQARIDGSKRLQELELEQDELSYIGAGAGVWIVGANTNRTTDWTCRCGCCSTTN